MSQRPARPVFDVDAFIVDVFRYIQRHKIPQRELTRRLQCGPHAIKRLIAHHTEPSLFMACALAEECDLDLNKYIRKKDNVC